MTLDAILLALAGILSNNKRGVAILPEVRIAQGDGIQISHPISGYELWLTGNADYAVIKYDDVRDYKGGCGHYTLSMYQFLSGPLRPLACSWWIQRGRIRNLERLHVPSPGQAPKS